MNQIKDSIDKSFSLYKVSFLLLGWLLVNLSWGQNADFVANTIEGCAPIRVQFTDMSTGNPVSWEWNFGKSTNTTSQLQNPSTTYTVPGVYQVVLTVEYNDGSMDTETKTAYIRVRGSPTVNFSANTRNGCLPSLDVSFVNSSIAGEGTITSWEWIFGDGGTSSEQNPTHTYTTSGQKTVTLTATNSVGCSSVNSQANFINVLNTSLNFSIQQSCNVPREIQFTNLSSGGGTGQGNYTWNFGDGNMSTETDPQHTYARQGTYTVSLALSGSTNCIRTREIAVGNTPTPDFQVANRYPICAGASIAFESSDPGIIAWAWNFGDGRQENSANNSITTMYNTGGIYNVTLTATYAGGCQGSATKQVTITPSPNPDFTVTGCTAERNFSFLSEPNIFIRSWAWQFGDGRESTLQNPTHIYTSKANFEVTLSVVSNEGCQGEVIKSIPVFNRPVAHFIPAQLYTCENATNPSKALGGCAPHTIEFEDRSNFGIPDSGGITLWTFGDGTSSNEQNPTHTFTNSGDYDVLLTITNSIGCQDQVTRIVRVTETAPTPLFSLDKTRACIGEDVRLTSSSTDANSWCWVLPEDENNPPPGISVTHKFNQLGNHDIKLVTGKDGCTDSLTIPDVIDIVGPRPDFQVNFQCQNPYEINIDNLSEEVTAGRDTWQWDFGDGQAGDQSYSPTHTYGNTGSYKISLTVQHAPTNCIVTAEENIEIVDVKADFSATPRVACRNALIQFTSESEFARELLWEFGDGTSLIDTGRQHIRPAKIYTQPGRYTITLSAVDIHGCMSRKDSVDFINILNINGNFTYSIADNRCNELDIDFTDRSTGMPDITGWLWNFGDNGTSNLQNPSHTYRNLGQYNVSVTLTNSEGQCTLTRNSLINFTNPEPNFILPKAAYCVNEFVSIINQSRNANTYSWQIEGHPLDSSINPSVQYNTTGTFDVALTATDIYGCTQTRSQADTIRIVDITADFTADSTRSDCPPLIASFNATASDQVRAWNWTFGDGGSSNFENPSYVYSIPGTYEVTLTVTSQYGCRDVVTKNAFIRVGGPYGSIALPKRACVDSPVTLEANTTNATVYEWDFGDGGAATTPVATHSYSTAKTYNPILQLSDEKGCIVFINPEHPIIIDSIPGVDFSFFDNYSFEGENIRLNAIGNQNLQWKWYMQDGSEYSESTLIYTLPMHGKLLIRLEGTNPAGCVGKIEKTVYVQEDIYFIPNVFTPNQDNKNNTFKILNVQNGFWNIIIYNRYGKIIHEQSEYDNGWRGNDASSGVYYYEIKNQYRPRSYKGYIQLLR